MLYISRKVTEVQFLVKDTDDNTEEMYTDQQLRDMVAMYDSIDIRGVVTRPDTIAGKAVRRVVDIVVYQLPESVNPYCAKIKALCGLDIVVNGDEIMYIGGHLNCSFTLVLSKIGRRCGPYMIKDVSGGILTLVLDNEIRVTANTFGEMLPYNIRMDLRQVTNKRTLNFVYRVAAVPMHFEPFFEYCRSCFIDDIDRLDLYIAMYALDHANSSAVERYGLVLRGYDRRKKVISLVEDYLGERFDMLFNMSLPERGRRNSDYESMALSWKTKAIASKSPHMFAIAYGRGITHFLSIAGCKDIHVFRLLCKYVTIFGGSDELIKKFDNFIIRLLGWNCDE